MNEWIGGRAQRSRGEAGKSIRAVLLASVFGLACVGGVHAETATPSVESSDTIDSLVIVAKPHV